MSSSRSRGYSVSLQGGGALTDLRCTCMTYNVSLQCMSNERTRDERMSERNAIASLTRWVLRHKRLIVGLWLVLALGGLAALRPAGDALSQQFNLPGTQGFIANRH